MRFHCNTTPDETIAFMRDHAIKSKAPAAMIDALDALAELLDLPVDLEKRDEELNKCESDRDDLWLELEEAAESLELAIDTIASIAKSPKDAAEMLDADELRGMQRQLKASQLALERHKT